MHHIAFVLRYRGVLPLRESYQFRKGKRLVLVKVLYSNGTTELT